MNKQETEKLNDTMTMGVFGSLEDFLKVAIQEMPRLLPNEYLYLASELKGYQDDDWDMLLLFKSLKINFKDELFRHVAGSDVYAEIFHRMVDDHDSMVKTYEQLKKEAQAAGQCSS